MFFFSKKNKGKIKFINKQKVVPLLFKTNFIDLNETRMFIFHYFSTRDYFAQCFSIAIPTQMPHLIFLKIIINSICQFPAF